MTNSQAIIDNWDTICQYLKEIGGKYSFRYGPNVFNFEINKRNIPHLVIGTGDNQDDIDYHLKVMNDLSSNLSSKNAFSLYTYMPPVTSELREKFKLGDNEKVEFFALVFNNNSSLILFHIIGRNKNTKLIPISSQCMKKNNKFSLGFGRSIEFVSSSGMKNFNRR